MTDSHLHFQIGDEVFVRDPQTLIPGCTCIVGTIDNIDSIGSKIFYEFDGSVGGLNVTRRMSLPAMKLGHRVGIPLSQLDGRNGGNQVWRNLSASWGYD